MSTRWMVGTATLLSFLYAGTANAQQEGKAGSPKAGESVAAAKPAPDKAAAEDKAPKKQLTVKKMENKLLLDSYGKPIREQFIDSKGKVIPFTNLPLKDAFLCYPPPGGAKEPAKERPAKDMSIKDVPTDYVCAPFQPEPQPVLQVLSITCSLPYYSCVTTYYPFHTMCCCCRP